MELDRVNSLWWRTLLRADFEELTHVQEEQRNVRQELAKMEWW